MHEIKKATYIEEYKILVEFDDSKSKVIDFKQALRNFKGEIFQPLKNIDYFKTFKISEGIATLAWDNGSRYFPRISLPLRTLMPRIRVLSKSEKPRESRGYDVG